MRINRVELLQKLGAVSAGIAKRENVSQSSCFVFKDGHVLSFNEEVACSAPLDLGFEGAVAADKLMQLLEKLAEENVDVSLGTGKDDGRVMVKGTGKGAWFATEAEILLPVDSVEKPADWRPIPEDFLDGVKLVRECAAQGDAQGYALSCVHFAPEWVECCDNFQAARYPCVTGLRQLSKNTLVRADTIKCILSLDMTEICETRNWLHFQNPAGLVISCRKWVEEYPDISAHFVKSDDEVAATLPKGLADAVDKAQLGSSENVDNNQVLIELRPGKVKVSGEGITMGYYEVKEIAYDGAPMKFMIAPKLLAEITKRHTACTLTPGRLRVDGGKFVFVSCLGVV